MKRTALKRKSPLKAKKKSKRVRAPITKLKKKLWELCKQITRERHGNTCYTCGKKGLEGGNWQTGHFIASSVCSTELRYDLKNLRPQCYHCNINLSGNWIAYEEHLIKDHGKKYISDLKQRNQATKGLSYREDWYLNKITEYNDQART